MNSSWKNILLVVALIGLSVGIGYLGMRIVTLDKTAPAAGASPGSTESTAPADTPGGPQASPLTASPAPEKINSLSDSKNCNTSAECTIVSEPGTYLDGKSATLNYCVNRTYLETCPNCTEDADFKKSAEGYLSCVCIDSTCQYPQGDATL